jgi:competence protein CoiA
MQFALVDGKRRAAERGLAGQCPACGSALIPKCGERRARHWAHRGERHCDHWWEPETEWHVAWKNRFPAEWQEIVHRSGDGKMHIADVRTSHGRIIEFQHSRIEPAERRSREIFYRSMVWVVDGLARKRDQRSFFRTLYRLHPTVFSGHEDECSLLRDWLGRPVEVFFDFGAREEDTAKFGAPVLWRLYPNAQRQVFLTPFPVAAFVEALHKGRAFPPLDLPRVPVPRPLPGFARYLRHQEQSRARF